jgi:transcriptional regulator with XRE-family HTH domain
VLTSLIMYGNLSTGGGKMSEEKKSKRVNCKKNILFYRKKNKLTQKQLAEKIGVQNSAISNWENGTNSIDIETLFKVCEVLGISMNTVFGTEETKPKVKQSPVLTKYNLTLYPKIPEN